MNKDGTIKPLDRIPTQDEVQRFADEIDALVKSSEGAGKQEPEHGAAAS